MRSAGIDPGERQRTDVIATILESGFRTIYGVANCTSWGIGGNVQSDRGRVETAGKIEVGLRSFPGKKRAGIRPSGSRVGEVGIVGAAWPEPIRLEIELPGKAARKFGATRTSIIDQAEIFAAAAQLEIGMQVSRSETSGIAIISKDEKVATCPPPSA